MEPRLVIRWLLKFIAFWRLDESVVCMMSKDMGDADYHDYPDAGEEPQHFYKLTCCRCGKKFII